MEERKEVTAPVEIEGGGMTWYYVCPECHGEVSIAQDRCEICGEWLLWGNIIGVGIPKERRGEE